MTYLLDDIETFIRSKVDLLEYGIFKDTTLDMPDNAVTIYEYIGVGYPPQISGALRSLQIVVRSKSSLTAKEKADALHKAFQTDDGIINLTPERWGNIYLRQAPFKIKVDGTGRIYYGFNFGLNTYLD